VITQWGRAGGRQTAKPTKFSPGLTVHGWWLSCRIKAWSTQLLSRTGYCYLYCPRSLATAEVLLCQPVHTQSLPAWKQPASCSGQIKA